MIWIVGKIHSGLAAYLAAHDISYGLFIEEGSTANPFTAAQIVALDMKDSGSIKHGLEAAKLTNVEAITVNGYENFIIPSSHIAAYYDLPGLSAEAALAATDKSVMRKCFTTHDQAITPRYSKVSSWTDIVSFMEQASFPVMLKPTGLMKSLYITRNDSLSELAENYEILQNQLAGAYKQYNSRSDPSIIIEEFLDGSMHTVAGFVDRHGNPQLSDVIADCQRASDIGVKDNYLFARTIPSHLDVMTTKDILRVAASGVRALKLTSCAVHIEIIVTKYGPKIIEIGARTGGYRPAMYAAATGIDFYGAQINTAFNRPVTLAPTKFSSAAVIELFPASAGRFDKLGGSAIIESLPSLSQWSVRKKNGDIIGPARDGYKAVATIKLASESLETVGKDRKTIESGCSVLLVN